MDKLWLCSFLAFSVVTDLAAQHVQFSENKTWAGLLADARQSGKLIFVDVYTDWCGPCKVMDKEVFTQKQVAEKLNKDFINYKMNAEKGEGISLAQHYNVFSYPTYLFIDGNGALIYRSNGSMPAEDFSQQLSNALIEQKEPVTLLQMDSIYSSGNKDTAFLYTYLRKRTRLKQDNTDLLDEYCTLLTQQQQGSLKTLQLIADNGAFNTRSLKIGKAISLLKQHQSLLPQLDGADAYEDYLYMAQEVTLHKAIALKSDRLMHLVLDACRELKYEVFDTESDYMLKLRYYAGTDQEQKYIDTAIYFLKKHLLPITDSTLAHKDKTVLDEVAQSMSSRLANKTEKEKQEALASYRHTQTIQWIRTVKTICMEIAKTSNNKSIFQQGINWTNRMLKMAKEDTGYYKYVYPGCIQTHAIYLYKSGQKQQAIRLQTEAVAKNTVPGIARDEDEIEEYKKTLQLMKEGKF